MRVQYAIKDFLPYAHSTAPRLKTITMRLFHISRPEKFSQSCALACRESCEELGLDIDINQINDSLSPGLWTTH